MHGDVRESGVCARVRLGFCMLFRARVPSRKKAAAISAKSEKGGGEARSFLLAREYPKMEPRAKSRFWIRRLVLDVISKRKAQRKLARTERRCKAMSLCRKKLVINDSRVMGRSALAKLRVR